MAKRVAIIGGGCSGLAGIKCCLDEGLEPVCLERTDQLGGLWNYTKQVREGYACVMRSTVINTSKEMMCYSDYPIPDHYANFMHNTQVFQYFKDYSTHFDLAKHIRYNTEVKMVRPAPDFDQTGRWSLRMQDHKSGEETEETYDAVLVCSGHHADKHIPSFKGLSDFKGEVIHSHDYREPSQFMDKRMLVVGIGNSGGDMAVELSRQGQVYLSTRRGTWIIHRVSDPGGQPVDIQNTRRYLLWVAHHVPRAWVDIVVKWKLNSRLDHDLYHLRPAYPPTAQHPMVNDDLPNRIICGKVLIKPDVKQFTATGVEFTDGTFEDNLDVVFLATGYTYGFPFLDKSVLDVKENRLPCFKYMFPPDLTHNTLAVIGCVQPVGAINPISELQCRLAVRVFKGDTKLPSSAKMWDDIRYKEADMARRYVKSPRHTIQVDYIQYMDEVATLCGCAPDLLTLLKRDPALCWRVFTGPCTPYQFRLCGPGQWDGARKAIMTTMERVKAPLATRPLPMISDVDRIIGFAKRLVVLFFLFMLLRIFIFV